MREYGKVSPQFWLGSTGRKLRGDVEAQIVAVYLMTSPHANMIGVFHCPVAYIAHETGLPSEGASKGLRRLIEADFCTYDDESEYVCVHEFAAHQIGDTLDPKDNRVKAVEKELEKVPKGVCWQAFRARYAVPFNLAVPAGNSKPLRSPLQAPSKPGAEAGAEAGKRRALTLSLPDWLESLKAKGESAIPETDPVFAYAETAGIPTEFLHLAWVEFRARYSEAGAKKYIDWRAVFRKAVRGNWLKLWWLDGQTYTLTTTGMQAQRVNREAA